MQGSFVLCGRCLFSYDASEAALSQTARDLQCNHDSLPQTTRVHLCHSYGRTGYYRTVSCKRRPHVQDHPKFWPLFSGTKRPNNETSYSCVRRTPSLDVTFWGKKVRLSHETVRYRRCTPTGPELYGAQAGSEWVRSFGGEAGGHSHLEQV